ncbi:MAG: metallophosphoesterase [bacterium]
MPWILGVVLVIFLPLAGLAFFVGKILLDVVDSYQRWQRKQIRLTLILLFGYLSLLPISFCLAFLFLGRGASVYFAGDYFLIDLFIIYPFWFFLVVLFQLFILFSIFELTSFIIKKVLKLYGEWLRNKHHLILSWTTVFIILYSAIVVIDNTWTIKIVSKKINLPSEMKQLTGVRLVQISDVQGDGRTNENKLRSFVKKVNALNPDIIIYAGDLVTSGKNYIASTARILGNLKPKYETYAVLGDHDYFSDAPMVIRELAKNGIILLQDTTITFLKEKAVVKITGVTYTYSKKPSEKELNDKTDNSLSYYKIMLSHQPAEELVSIAVEQKYQLFLAGHTHGGGISFGIPGIFLLAPANFESRYVSGFYEKGKTLISVNNGLGFTLAPIRFHAPAQITVLDFD